MGLRGLLVGGVACSAIMYVMPNKPDRSLLEAVLNGLEAKKARIDEHITAVRSQLGVRGPGRPPKSATPPPARKERHMSAAGRKAIADAARRRWAAVRTSKDVAGGSASPKRRISAAGRKRIAGAEEALGNAKSGGQEGEQIVHGQTGSPLIRAIGMLDTLGSALRPVPCF